MNAQRFGGRVRSGGGLSRIFRTQTSLIAFQADHLIGLPINDPPASHRINGHDGAPYRQKGRQFGNARNSGMVVVSFDLSSTLRCPGTGFRSQAQARGMSRPMLKFAPGDVAGCGLHGYAARAIGSTGAPACGSRCLSSTPRRFPPP